MTTAIDQQARATMSESDIRERLRFVGFIDEDADNLRTLLPWVQTISAEFARIFYDKSFSDAGFAAIVGAANGARTNLEQAQAAYCIDLFRGMPTSGYVAHRQKIGALHGRIGVTPQYYIGSYAFYYDILYPMIRSHFGGLKRRKAERVITSVGKLLLFDQSIVMEEYLESLMGQLRSLVTQVATSANGVAETPALSSPRHRSRPARPHNRSRRPASRRQKEQRTRRGPRRARRRRWRS